MLPFSRMGFSPPFPGLSGLAPGKGQAIEGRPTILSTLSCWWKFVDLACQIKSYYCYLLIDGIIVVANQSLKTNLAKKTTVHNSRLWSSSLSCLEMVVVFNIKTSQNQTMEDLSMSAHPAYGQAKEGILQTSRNEDWRLLYSWSFCCWCLFVRRLGTICFEQIFIIWYSHTVYKYK